MRSRRPMHEWRRGGSKIPELQSFSNSLLRPRLVLAQTLTASWAKIKIIPPIQAGFGDVRALRTIAVAYLDACQIRPTLQITELSMRKVHMPLAADLRRLVLRTPLKWGRCAAPVVLLLHAVLSWSTGLAAERQADRADQPPDYWAETDGGQVQWMDNNTTSILRSTCSPYSTLWARANLSGYTVVWNHALALRDTFLVLIDSTGADLPPAQVVQNFLNTKRGEFSDGLRDSLESLYWRPITRDWDTLVVPQGSVVIVNPSESDIDVAPVDIYGAGTGKHLVYSSPQDTLLFFFESKCISADTGADISDDDAVDSADSSSVDSGLSAELLSIVELWSGEYWGTGRREYSEWLTFTGSSRGYAPRDSTVTAIYNADNPIHVRMVLEDETVFAVYIDVPGRFQGLRNTLDLESFKPGSTDSSTYYSWQYEGGTHLGPDSMVLGLHLSINYTDGVYLIRESDGAIRGRVSFEQHYDLAPYHSKETVDFVVYPGDSADTVADISDDGDTVDSAEGQTDTVVGPPDRWNPSTQQQWVDNKTTAILRSTCNPYSKLWARANLSGYTAVWNHALGLRDTFLVLIDSTGADLPPAQVVQNFLNPERGEFSNELKRSLESLTWTPITSDWDTLVVPQGSVVIVNPSEPDIHRASIDMELGLGNYLIPSLSWQDTLLFFFESGCTSVDTVADISDDDTVDSADSSSVDSGLSAELLSIVELWSDEYLGTGRREYSEWLTFSGESNGFAPWDSTATTIYNADNPIRVRMVLEDETVFAVYIDVPGRFQRLRKTLDLESFEPGSADSDTYISMDSEAGTHLGSDSMGLGIHLSMNFTDGVYITRESDGAIRGEVSFAQHRDLAPYHSKETVHFVVYPRNSDTLVSERETGQVPEGSYLYQNAPNPFNGSTVLRYDLDREQPVKLVIYSLGGQRVVQLVDTVQMPGYYELIWDGRDGNGRRLASGLYLARLLADQVVETRKLLLIR